MRASVVPFAAAALLLTAGRSEAGLIVITSGTTIKHIGEITEEKRQEMRKGPRQVGQLGPRAALMTDPQVGFRYQSFDVFWIPLWTWNGSYCLYQGRTEAPIPPEKAADYLGRSVDELHKPFAYRYPPGLLILGGILLISIPAGLLKRRGEVKTHALLADPRYQQALQMYRQGAQSEAAFEDAVLSLEREGISRNEAVRNLRALLAHLAQKEQQIA